VRWTSSWSESLWFICWTRNGNYVATGYAGTIKEVPD
jgi:hypothetical protein